MLDQRRAQEKGYITLKEAAEFCDYSPDYIGQLIRAGKIKGQQVYSNLAWVTTVEDIEAYTNSKVGTKKNTISEKLYNFLFSKDFPKLLLYIIIIVLIIFLLIIQYILYVSVDKILTKSLEPIESSALLISEESPFKLEI